MLGVRKGRSRGWVNTRDGGKSGEESGDVGDGERERGNGADRAPRGLWERRMRWGERGARVPNGQPKRSTKAFDHSVGPNRSTKTSTK